MIHSTYRALTLFDVFMFYCEDTPALITRVVLPSVIYFYCCLEGAELGQSAAFSVRWSTHSLCILSWIFLFCTFFFFKYSFVWWVFCDSVPNKAILGSALHSRCTKQRSYSLCSTVTLFTEALYNSPCHCPVLWRCHIFLGKGIWRKARLSCWIL